MSLWRRLFPYREREMKRSFTKALTQTKVSFCSCLCCYGVAMVTQEDLDHLEVGPRNKSKRINTQPSKGSISSPFSFFFLLPLSPFSSSSSFLLLHNPLSLSQWQLYMFVKKRRRCTMLSHYVNWHWKNWNIRSVSQYMYTFKPTECTYTATACCYCAVLKC